jgi:uncharacterized protein YoxC
MARGRGWQKLADFLDFTRKSLPDRVKSVVHWVKSVTDLIKSLTDLTRSVTGLINSTTDFTVSEIELIKSVSDFTQSTTELIQSETDFTKSVIELTQSVTDFTKSVIELIKSVTDITRSVTDITKSAADFRVNGTARWMKTRHKSRRGGVVGTARCAVRAGLRHNVEGEFAFISRVIPSPDAALGDGDAAARHPYHLKLPSRLDWNAVCYSSTEVLGCRHFLSVEWTSRDEAVAAIFLALVSSFINVAGDGVNVHIAQFFFPPPRPLRREVPSGALA